jgi:hypothetical protein
MHYVKRRIPRGGLEIFGSLRGLLHEICRLTAEGCWMGEWCTGGGRCIHMYCNRQERHLVLAVGFFAVQRCFAGDSILDARATG